MEFGAATCWVVLAEHLQVEGLYVECRLEYYSV